MEYQAITFCIQSRNPDAGYAWKINNITNYAAEAESMYKEQKIINDSKKYRTRLLISTTTIEVIESE